MGLSLSVVLGPDHRGLSPSPTIIIGRKKALMDGKRWQAMPGETAKRSPDR